MRNDYETIVPLIQTLWYEYLKKYNFKSVVNGVSGGFDSALNCALLKPVCDELGIPLIGRYIHIETNKEEERFRAGLVGKYFCTDYAEIDWTNVYQSILPEIEDKYKNLIFIGDNSDKMEYKRKISRGNIKARLRMIKLRNIVAENDGILINNDNKTEYELGFFTLDGDVGDITPLSDLYKTEAYELAKFYKTLLLKQEEIDTIQLLIDAVPTDGLGITSSDVEQFGANSYYEVDDILSTMLDCSDEEREDNYYKLLNRYGEVFLKVWNRHVNSEFKRNYPYKFKL